MNADVLIIGAGPAGMAAAVRAKEAGAEVVVVDDNQKPGGQIWRGGQGLKSSGPAQRWLQRFSDAKATVLANAQAFTFDLDTFTCSLETEESVESIRFVKLILASGAREFFIPFSGWTLPGVVGAGGIQSLAKAGVPIEGKRIVVGGSGPLLLAVAAYLTAHGAKVVLIAEQASRKAIARFAFRLPAFPNKALQAALLRFNLGSIPYRADCVIEAAHGDNRLRGVTLRSGAVRWTEECDYAAVAYGLHPNTELASLLGCRLADGGVAVDEFQRSSVAGVLAAGECTGIGGVDMSIVEGEIAGYAATNNLKRAGRLFAKRNRARRFARLLADTFTCRAELRDLCQSDTIVCRCEDVSYERLSKFPSFRAAKLHTRCGMGPCQARICSPAAEFLFGWADDTQRPPAFPVRVGSLIRHNAQGVADQR